MKIEKYIIDRVLSATHIEEVVGDFVTLKKSGVRYIGCCPFHEDRHAGSFVVYPRGNCYKCFVCEAKGDAVKFLREHEKMSFVDAIRYLAKKYNIDIGDMESNYDYRPPVKREEPEPLPTLLLPMKMVEDRATLTSGNLIEWIRTGIRWDSVQRKRIDEVLRDYHIGASRQGHTIFWLIDEDGGVRTGKMMKYRADGHRDKDARWNFDFIHATLRRRRDAAGNTIEERPWPFPQYYDPDKQEMRLTLFGMHLLRKYPQATVHIVESEKTALLMSIAYGNHARQVWMASGGLMNLSRERLAPIIREHRQMILYPDRDGIERWQQQAERLHYDRLTVDVTPVTKWWVPSDGEKADIADVVVRIINNSDWHPKTADEVAEKMPKAKGLIDRLELTPAEE